mgnify:CR=1 FL=1
MVVGFDERFSEFEEAKLSCNNLRRLAKDNVLKEKIKIVHEGLKEEGGVKKGEGRPSNKDLEKKK